jgi:hypothetical protein
VRITYIRDDGRATYPQQGKSSSLPLTPTVPHPTVPRLKNQRSLFSPDCLSNEFEQGEAFRGINKNAASRTMLLCSSPLLSCATPRQIQQGTQLQLPSAAQITPAPATAHPPSTR